MASRGSGASKGTGSSRPGSRPASARRTSTRSAGPTRASGASKSGAQKSSAQRSGAQRQAGNGLWRWGVIALVAVVLLVLLAPTMRSYFAQRGEIVALEREVAASEERVAELQAERERWRDPAYVEQQARERLKFVRPGDVSYTVIGADEIQDQQVAVGQVPGTGLWYARLWSSMGQADQADPEPVP